MKQTILMIALTFFGVQRSLTVNPFYGVAVYYFYAILRPQYLWAWSLPEGVNWSLYVALAAIAGVFLGVRPKSSETRPTPEKPAWSVAHRLMMAFAICVFFSYLAGPHTHPELGNLFLIEYAKHFIMFAVAATVICRIRDVWIVVIIFAGTLGYIAYEINYLYFVNGYLGIQRNGYGGSDNNGAGLLLALGVPMCYFVWEGIRCWWGWLFLGLIPVIVHAVLMTYSRGAMVALIACCPLFFLRSKRRLPLLAFTTAMVFLVPMLAGKEMRERFLSINDNEDESAKSRYGSWSAAWRITCDYPLFGSGMRGSNVISYHYGTDMQGRTIHNQYLQVFADNGFPGGILYITVIVLTWFGLRRVRRVTRACDTEENREAYASACAIEGALVVFGIGAMFLSCEAFECQYILLLLGAQLPIVTPSLCGEPSTAAADESWIPSDAHWKSPAPSLDTQPAEKA